MADISNELEKILQAKYGEEVRGSIHDALKKMNEIDEVAEAYAVGTRGGSAVPSGDPAYQNNAKYYAEQAAASAAVFDLDDTLSVTGKAADSKAVGNRFDIISNVSIGENLIDNSMFTVTVGTSFDVDPETGIITVTSTNTGSNNSVQTEEIMGNILVPGKRYRLSAHAEAVSGSPSIRVAMRGTHGGSSSIVPGTAINFTANNITDGYSEFVADEYIKRVSLFVSTGSSTKNSISEFSNVELREIISTAIDTEARRSVADAEAEIGTLQNDAGTLKASLYDGTVSGWVDGYAFSTGNASSIDPNSPTAVSTYRYAIVSCLPGDIFTLNLDTGASYRGWNFLDSSYNILSKANNAISHGRNLVVSAPAQSAYLLIQSRDFIDSYKGKHLSASTQDQFEAVDDAIGLRPITHYFQSVSLSGESVTLDDEGYPVPSTNDNYNCRIIPCSAGATFSVTGNGGTGARLWGFVDSEGNVLSVASASTNGNNLQIMAPVGTSWCIVHTHKSYYSCVRRGDPIPAFYDIAPFFVGNKPLMRAHQGAKRVAPANSYPAYELACQEGFGSVQIAQVRMSADGTWYIMHNETIDATTNGTGEIAELSDEYLATVHINVGENVDQYTDEELHIPTLEEVLTLCRRYGVYPSIRFGTGGVFPTSGSTENWESLLNLVEKFDTKQMIFSGDVYQIRRFRSLRPVLYAEVFSDNIAELMGWVDNCISRGYRNLCFLSAASSFTEAMIKKIHHAGYQVAGYTSPTTAETVLQAVDAGFDIIQQETFPDVPNE